METKRVIAEQDGIQRVFPVEHYFDAAVLLEVMIDSGKFDVVRYECDGAIVRHWQHPRATVH